LTARPSIEARLSVQDKSRRFAYASLRLEANRACGPPREDIMTIDAAVLNPLIALIAGILILLMPRLLNYVVAIYLIAIGILGLAHHFQ
jgi:hypothetical protein